MPNCFWPWAGSCFAVNNNATAPAEGEKSSYEKVTGQKWNIKDKGRTFLFGELVFFKPAPTIDRQDKLDSTLRAGVFLDYYINFRGEFTGQYIVCELEDFIGANLYHRAENRSFKLHIHRTEVCRLPVNMPNTPVAQLDNPIFPLREKFCKHNIHD